MGKRTIGKEKSDSFVLTLPASLTGNLRRVRAKRPTKYRRYRIIYTGVFVSVLPLPVVYLLLRKLLTRSVMSGAIKG